MKSELIPLKFEKVIQSPSYTCIVLGTEKKKIAIYTEASNGKILQMYLTSLHPPRPPTHALMTMIFKGFDIKIRQVIINDLQDTIYLARLFVEQKINDILHIVEIDARPSDCITFALINKVPVFCLPEVFEKAIPIET